MYPAFGTTRPRLPSVHSVFQPIEQYQSALGKRASLAAVASVALEPLDAYLIHLLVNVHPGEPAILDLASEATAGASTVLGVFHPHQPPVRAAYGPMPGDGFGYRGVVEEFLQRQGKSLSPLRWLSHDEAVEELRGETDTIVLVAGNGPAVADEVEQWLNIVPSAIVLVVGLGPVGDCAILDALVRRFPSGSPRRLTLLRESGEVLCASKLGLVANRDNTAAETALRRLTQLFTGNYSFLGLMRSVTEQAIYDSGCDTSVRESKGYFLEWNHEINQLKKTAQHARENAAAAEELQTLKSSIGYRLSERFRRWRKQLAPDRSWRYGVLQLVRRFGHVCRHEGISGLLRRIVRRLRRSDD